MSDKITGFLALALIFALPVATIHAQERDAPRDGQPNLLSDRGAGIPTSQFGTYIESGQWMVYPFVEYDKNTNEEYSPIELGFPQPGVTGEEEFFGELSQREAVLFIGYGLSEKFALEFEAEMYVDATLQKSLLDPSPVPQRIHESGFAGAEAQIRWMMREETAERRALYSFYEMEFPFQDKKVLIGAQDVEVAAGIGFIRHHSWGTLNGRMSVAFDGAENKLELGEYAIEYLKRVNDRWRVVGTIEGEDDEVSLIGEGQLTLREGIILKLNSGFGLTKKASDFAPEIGVIFTF